ncbi:MAG: RNA chaperone Hfq [Deltaproteobacteria bacterium]|nr:RNA chaperone Hfq [Deltaproteobacteria bacterium]
MAMRPRINVQDQFLNQARRERIKITMELSDGQKVEGIIKSFDNYCVVLDGERFHLVYKHAITNVNVPAGSKMAQLFGEGASQPPRDRDRDHPGGSSGGYHRGDRDRDRDRE